MLSNNVRINLFWLLFVLIGIILLSVGIMLINSSLVIIGTGFIMFSLTMIINFDMKPSKNDKEK